MNNINLKVGDIWIYKNGSSKVLEFQITKITEDEVYFNILKDELSKNRPGTSLKISAGETWFLNKEYRKRFNYNQYWAQLNE